MRERQVIKKSGDLLYVFIDKILKPHAEYFHTQISHIGCDKTDAEKARRLIIPFYDFVENVNERNIIGATISFLSEFYSLASPFLKSATFLLRYSNMLGKQALASSMLIAKTLGKANINIVLQKATQEFIRKGVVPAAHRVSKKEIVHLGIDMMQSFVPGFDLTHSLSSYTSRKIFKSISSVEGVFSTSLKRSTTFTHRHFSLSMQGNYRFGLKDLVSCTLTPRIKRSPTTLNFLCLPTASNKIITKLKREVSRVTTEWNIHPNTRDPRLFAEDIKILELLASKQKEELLAINAYTSAGSGAINMQLRTTPAALLSKQVRNKAGKILAQYHHLEEYRGFSYRIMNAKNSAIEGYQVGDILTDRGFVSSSALLTNTKNWYASQWMKERKKVADGNLLIIYDHSVEKKIASNSLLADHLLIKPNTKLKIVDRSTIVTTEGEVINVIAVKHYQKAKPAMDIYSGEIISP